MRLSRFILLLAGILATTALFGEVLTDFSEASLDPAIQLDIPNAGRAAIILDPANDELDFTTTGNTDMWVGRNNAPIAWTARPVVQPGITWYAETYVRYNGQANAGNRVAGITLYGGPDGTGGSSGGMDFSIGLNDWNNFGVEFQGWGASNVGDSGVRNIGATGHDEAEAHLRLEVTENGVTDAYVGYWKASPEDEWIQFARFNSSVNNARVGLFFKTGNALAYPADSSVSFTYFNVAETIDITDPNDSEPDGMGDNWETFYFDDLTRDGTLDFDSDGRTDLEEWGDKTNPTKADTDDDGLTDGVEASRGTDPLDADSDDDDWTDGEEVAAGSDPNDETSFPSPAPAPDLYASVPMPKRDAVVVFNEIHYHPAGDDLSLEFIELHNQMVANVDMSNWRLRGEADFDFPEGTVIPGGGYLVVARNPGALAAATGHMDALGPFVGALSNSGGRLRLYNNNRSFRTQPGGIGSPGEIRDSPDARRIMDEITYGDTDPWPAGADGSGSSLAKREAASGTPHPINWSASAQTNGTPGFVNAATLRPALALNEVSASTSGLFRVELLNYGTSSVLLDDMILVSSDPAHPAYILPAGSLGLGMFTTIDATTLGFTPADNNRLFLFSAGRSVLIDAVRIDDRAKARQPDGSGRWLRPDVATFGSANVFDIEDDIVINEIFYHAHPEYLPYAEREEEWVELYNRGTSAVELTGWKLSGGIDYSFPDLTSIAAGAYLVVAKDAAALATNHPAATIIGDYADRLGNGGDLVVLEDARGNPADEVRYYDDGKWHPAAGGGGASLELVDGRSDNRYAGAWAASDESSRTEWKTYSYEGVALNDGLGNNVYHEFLLGMLDAGEVLIDDVSVLENPNGAAIEFIQNRDFKSDTIGTPADKWRAIGTHGSHGRTVVVEDPDAPGNQCLHLVATGPTEDKHNKLETTYAGGQTVVAGTTYRISFRAKWLNGSSQVNTRLYFNYLQRTTQLDVPSTWGTPGAINSRAMANAGPSLSALSHRPVVPDANEAVTVRIDAHDPDGIGELTLFYSVNAGAFQSVPMLASSGQTYSGTIPGQPASRIIRFYVRGQDSINVPSFFPARASAGGAFYKVQDGLADTTGQRHNFRIVMAEADRQFLFLNTNRMSNDRFPVTIIDNESRAYYDVGLRLKASPAGRYGSGGYGFNIRFQPDALFRGVHATVSVERSGNLKEILAKHLMNRSGGGYWSFYDDVAHIITPTTGDRGPGLLSMARHTRNFFDGLFPDADAPGSLFNLELLYSPNGTTGGPEGLKIGNPYNHTNGRYDLADRGPDKETYRWGYQARSARARDDYSQMVALNQAMALSGPALKQALDPLIDVDQWMRTFAMMSLNGTDDVYGRFWEHNFRYYVRPTDQKIITLQWDMDRSFRLGASTSITPANNNQGTPLSVAKLFVIPQYRRLFDGHLDDLIQTSYNSTYLTPWASHFTTLTGDGMTGIPSYVANRANFAETTLPATIPFAITTQGGANFEVVDSLAELEGDAWVDVFMIEVDGVPTAVNWTDADSWQLIVPIGQGANDLILTGINNRGVVVGSDSITITNTSPVALANTTNTVISELHYHPADPSPSEISAGYNDAEMFEFIELTNTSNNDVDFTQVRFTDGITFTFPDRTILRSEDLFIIVANQDAFEFRYGVGAANIVGVYSDNLRNSGEHIRLEAADTTPIADFEYFDLAPWPASSDGAGYSLVFVAGDPLDALNWRSSIFIGGNPGYIDSVPDDGGGGPIDYALGGAVEGIVIDGQFVLDVKMNLGADQVRVYAQFSDDLGTWLDVGAVGLIARINHGDGTATYSFVSPMPIGLVPRQYGRIAIEPR